MIKSLLLVLRVRVYQGRGWGRAAVASEVCRGPGGGRDPSRPPPPGHGGNQTCPHPAATPPPVWLLPAGMLILRLIGFTSVHNSVHLRSL